MQGYLFDKCKELSDEDRELTMKWSVMHMYSSSQLAVFSHSDKSIVSNNKYVEAMKVIDSLDRYL